LKTLTSGFFFLDLVDLPELLADVGLRALFFLGVAFLRLVE
jgi:hypothetical protein